MADDNLEQQETTEATEDATLDLDLEGGEAEAAKKEPEPESPAVRQAKQEAEDARRQLSEERARRERAEALVPAPRPSADAEFEREEEQIRNAKAQGASAESLSWLQWQIDSNRRLRAMERSTQQATQLNSDMADKADFDRLERSEPKRYRFFAPKVEEIVANMKRNGQTVQPGTRGLIYDNLIGKAVREGTLKLGGGKPPAEPGTVTRQTTVDRGRMPPSRSDVNPRDKSGQTEHQKRIERIKAAHARGEYL